MKTRNNLLALAIAALLLPICGWAGDDCETGVWISDFTTATNCAFTTQKPLVLVASKSGCDHCADLKATFETSAVKTWMSKKKYLFCLVTKNSKAKEYDYIATAGNTKSDISKFPYVAVV